MFEILLDENSEKEKREKVRTTPDLPKLLFNVRGLTEEQKAAFPSPPPRLEDEVRSREKKHALRQPRGAMPRGAITPVLRVGQPPKYQRRDQTGPSPPPSPCLLLGADPFVLGGAKLVPKCAWRNLSVGSELCTSASWAPTAPTSTSQSQVWEFGGGVLEAGVVPLTCPLVSPPGCEQPHSPGAGGSGRREDFPEQRGQLAAAADRNQKC